MLYLFVKTLLSMLSASEVFIIIHFINFSLDHKIKSRLLHLMKKLEDHTNEIIDMMQESYCVMFIRKDVYRLLNKINNLILNDSAVNNDCYFRLMLLCLNVNFLLAWSVREQYQNPGLLSSEWHIVIRFNMRTVLLYVLQHSSFIKDQKVFFSHWLSHWRIQNLYWLHLHDLVWMKKSKDTEISLEHTAYIDLSCASSVVINLPAILCDEPVQSSNGEQSNSVMILLQIPCDDF